MVSVVGTYNADSANHEVALHANAVLPQLNDDIFTMPDDYWKSNAYQFRQNVGELVFIAVNTVMRMVRM